MSKKSFGKMKTGFGAVLAVVTAIVLFSGYFNDATVSTASTSPAVETVVEVFPSEVSATVSATEVAETVGAYSRDQFGNGWAYTSKGCNTRHAVLVENMKSDVSFVEGSNCKPYSGTMWDMYADEWVQFDFNDSGSFPVDHVFSLSEAWKLGASGWTVERRVEFANDPLNLVPTGRYLNSWKSDKSANEMLVCVNDVSANCAPREPFVGMDAFLERYELVAVKYCL